MLRIDRYTWIYFAVAFAFLVLKVINIAPKISDENIYFYDAYLITHGVLPYRDFFLASLPGQLVSLTILIKIFGFNLFILKLVPIIASIGSGWLIFKMVCSELKDSRGGLLGVFSATLFLFSFSVLVTTDHGTGVHEATFFLLLSWYFLARKRRKSKKIGRPHSFNIILAGLSLFAALAVRTYIIPAAAGFAIFLLYQRRFKRLFLYGLSAFLPYAALNGIFYLLYGDKFYSSVWQYHFLKTEGIDKNKIFFFFLQNEWLLLVGFVVAIIFVFNSRRFQAPNSILVGMTAFGLLTQSLFLFIYKDLYYLYLVVLIPFFAVLAASALNRVMLTKSTHKTDNGKISAWGKYLSILGIIFVLFNSFNYLQNHAPTSVIGELERIVTDTKGLIPNGGRIWGTFAVAPLVALETGNSITDNQVDSNVKRVSTGLWTAKDATNTAVGSDIFIQLAVIAPPTQDSSLGPVPAQSPNAPMFDSSTGKINGQVVKLDPDYISQHVIQDKCKLFRVYKVERDYDNNAILLWECRQK